MSAIKTILSVAEVMAAREESISLETILKGGGELPLADRIRFCDLRWYLRILDAGLKGR